MALVSVAAPFLAPSVAQAQESPEAARTPTPQVGGSPVVVAGNTYEEVKKQINGFFATLTIGAVTALMNASQMFMQKIAYDAAQRILTGDKGKYPMFWDDGYGDHMQKVAEDAGNQFISSINTSVLGEYGIDLCSPIDPLELQISLGVQPIEPLQNTCTIAKIAEAFDQTKQNFETSKEVFNNLSKLFQKETNGISIGLKMHQKFLDVQAQKLNAAISDRMETKGMKHVTDIISGKITTPNQEIENTMGNTNAIKQQIAGNEAATLVYGMNAFRIGFTQLAVITASTFVNTLAVGLLDKFFKGISGGGINVSQVDLVQSDSVTNQYEANARIMFSDLLTPNLISTDQQDFVAELGSCPDPRGLWGCSMDDALVAALRSVGIEGAYTVGRASHVVLNGLPPSNPEFIHKDWELIPETEAKDNTDPTCYQRAYCATNLAKLRYARILPVGWEMAANSPYNRKINGKYITVEQVILGFDSCNDEGQADAKHPWCKLIDPNWVLSAPPFQCRVKGGGDTIFSDTSMRLEECSDSISCLGRDDRGKCNAGYGFCLAEKPVWRFAGEVCQEKFASCRTYTGRDQTMVSYLRNTIDYGSCSADNIGCLWYSNLRDTASSSTDAWVGDLNTGSRTYFDSGIVPCDASNEGCTALLEVKQNETSLNLIKNSSFEQLTDDGKKLIGWSLGIQNQNDYIAPDAVEGLSAQKGSHSLSPSEGFGTEVISDKFALAPLRNYTLSLYARNFVPTVKGNFNVDLMMKKADGTNVTTSNLFRSAGCKVMVVPQKLSMGTVIPTTLNSAWVRAQCSFVTDPEVASGYLSINGEGVLLDAIQLEETEKATDYVDGVSTALATAHIRIAPEELDCRGSKDDHPLCANYARVCKQLDQGCQGYSDVQNGAAPEIPASLSAVDYCPATCVGYAEYRKQPTAFDLGKDANPILNDPEDDTSANFVPAYARQCSLIDVGCEEFTDVGSTSTGAEVKGYFNYVRACEKPSGNTETYFTWEGSDTTGYQLRTWSLIKDVATKPAAPKILQKTGPEGYLKNPLFCNVDSWQAGSDPDCRQFYNADGAVFYKYFSQTVISDNECKDLRSNNNSKIDCEKTGGEYKGAAGCVYKVLPSESRSCSTEAVGCRAYIGTTGRNTALVLEEHFRGTTSTNPFTAGTLSNESVLVGDQSLKITAPSTITTTVFPSSINSLYSVSFWAKTSSNVKPEISLTVDGKVVGQVRLSVDWTRYEVGPFAASDNSGQSKISWGGLVGISYLDEIRVERLQDVTYVVKDSWQVPAVCDQSPSGLPEPQAMLGCRSYRDRTGAIVNVRRFGHLCQEEVIGCKAFVDTRNSVKPYAEDFVLTGTDVNSRVTAQGQPIQPAYSFEEKYLGTATTTRPADRFIYVVDEENFRCPADKASCRAFGKPKYAQDQLSLVQATGTNPYETVYFIDDITKYLDQTGEPGILCRKNELFCEEFKSGKTVAYFRAPQDHACEWKDIVKLEADVPAGIPISGDYSGWFRVGTDEPCYPQKLASGNSYGLEYSGDSKYSGWVGMCPEEQSECTEFRDPNDHSDPAHVTGKPYFFIKNSHLDLTSCGGRVDLLSGCVLFRDMSDARNQFSTAATYAKAKAEGDRPQAPIDCVTDPDNDYCYNDPLKKGVLKNVRPSGECTTADYGVTFSCKGMFDPSLVGYVEHYSMVNGQKEFYYDGTISAVQITAAVNDLEGQACTGEYLYNGDKGIIADCVREGDIKNDSNVIMKVKLDRDCAQWLGCSTNEVVYDPAQQKYVDLCTEVALCNKSKGANAGNFCANYVNRATDPIFKPGVFFSSEVYASRKIGFGELDYSGYTIPEQFQTADLKNVKVAQDLFEEVPRLATKYATDYRLAAAIPESTDLVTFPLSDDEPVDALYPFLNICTHKQTGRKGYYLTSKAKGDRTCYFAIDSRIQRTALGDITKLDPRSIQPLSDAFSQTEDARYEKSLMEAFPPAECKSYPENDAPFPNMFVKDWNFGTEPYTPKEYVLGYEKVNLCEYGEDCTCSYRRVKYGEQRTLFYSAFGKAPLGGLCSGGSKDGQSCIPGQQVAAASGEGTTEVGSTEDPGCPNGGRCVEASSVVLARGEFGQCLQRDYSRSIAGDPGRHPCLVWNPGPILTSTYDKYHFSPKAGYTPPVNAGEYYCIDDAEPPFETVWSAQNHTSWDSSFTKIDDNKFFYLPGKLSKFNYDRGYIAGRCPSDSDTCGDGEDACNCLDGVTNIENVTPMPVGEDDTPANRDYDEIMRSVNGDGAATKLWDNVGDTGTDLDPEDCTTENDPLNGECDELWRFQDLGQNIDGVSLDNNDEWSWQAQWCAQAAASIPDDDTADGSDSWPGHGGVRPGIGPEEKSPDVDYSRGRWIMTGRGIGNTQMEYFFAVKPTGVYTWLNGEGAKDDDDLGDSLEEANFAQFQFFMVNDGFNYACSLPKFYVDNPPDINFNDEAAVKGASNVVVSQFNKDFDGLMDRSKEIIVKDENGKPIREKCSGLNDGNSPDYASNENGNGLCYFKAWEVNYRMDGVEKFTWLNEKPGESFWERHDDYYNRERLCTKSGFSIRAMFENTSQSENNVAVENVDETQLLGPYKFIGFWVTSCAAGTNFETFLYLGLRVKHADACNKLAQVVSPFTRENAAFSDRVWSKGSFSIPLLGFNYATQYSPFGSALVNGIPGIEPLFQIGPVENYSPLKPPTFLGSGAEYFDDTRVTPKYKWEHLTNIFARVYRIYNYYQSGVGRNGWACTGGINKGVACPNPTSYTEGINDEKWKDDVNIQCGGIGYCKEQLVDEDLNKIGRCNGLSGVNAGLQCGNEGEAVWQDPSCHNAPMLATGGGNHEPLYTKCELRTGWAPSVQGEEFAYQGGTPYSAGEAYLNHDAFGCGENAVVPGSSCHKPEDESYDCPLRIDVGDIVGSAEAPEHSCIIEESPSGPENGHCGSFTSPENGKSGNFGYSRCNKDEDCVFTEQQWWGAYHDPKKNTGSIPGVFGDQRGMLFTQGTDIGDVYMLYMLLNDVLGQTNSNAYYQAWAAPCLNLETCIHPLEGYKEFGANASLVDAYPLHKNVFLPFKTMNSDGVNSGRTSVLGPDEYNVQPFAWMARYGYFVRYGHDNIYRWPRAHIVQQANPESSDVQKPLYLPGACEGVYGAAQDPYDSSVQPAYLSKNQVASNLYKWGTPIEQIPPEMQGSLGYYYYGYGGDVFANQPTTPDDSDAISKFAKCKGGINDGMMCWKDDNCMPDANVEPGKCEKVADIDPASGKQTPVDGCKLDVGDPYTLDPELDNNSCTRKPGYQPWLNVCGFGTAENEKCLLGYDLAGVLTNTLIPTETSLPPTDVTPGFHNPKFLGLSTVAEEDYQHISFYAPRPPTVAAPDLSNACQTPGQCPIAEIGSFALEDQVEGPLYYGGGQAQVTMRFYGWAAHDQTPLKAMYVDWGDGTITKVENGRIKNKKPFCGVKTECELIPGLTCSNDSDCPPKGGKCVPRGTCSSQPALLCSRDNECRSFAHPDDKCEFRELFGNSDDACEPNYFELSHAYACERKNAMTSCLDVNAEEVYRCNRNPDQICTPDSKGEDSVACGIGDSCVIGLAPSSVEGISGGCFDENDVVCRYTPKLILKDNWNWCTGECRAGTEIEGQLSDKAGSAVKHLYGGCWDGTETKRNTYLKEFLMDDKTNECSLDYKALKTTVNRNIRPWVVYKGAVNVGVIQ